MFTSLELQQIAAIVRRHPHLVVISDEVYKYTIYDPSEVGDSTAVGHHHFAALPGTWELELIAVLPLSTNCLCFRYVG